MRKIATVTYGGKTYYFWGCEEVYSLPDQGRIAETHDVLDCRGGVPARMEGATKKSAKKNVKEIANAMDGNTAAFCRLGRERSAIAIFSVLFVEHGLSKAEAWQLIEAAVANSYPNEFPNRAQVINQTFQAIPASEGYANLAAKYAVD